MKNNKMRKLAILVAVMMLVMSFSSTGFASWLDQTIKASYRNISVYVNGTVKQAKNVNGVVIEPFIVDGTTYVPLRGIADILGYQVSFNPTTYRIDITGTDISTLTQRIIQQEATIKALEAKLAAQTVDLDDLEVDLNDDYPEFDSTLDIVDIVLDGDEDDIEVEIYLDERDDNADFDYWYDTIDLYEDDIIDFLQEVVDDILNEYEDADITGFIGFEEDNDTYVDFSIESDGDVNLGSVSSGSIDNIAELEDELRIEFDTDSASGFDFIINVTDEDGDEITVEVEIQDEDIDDLSSGDLADIDAHLEDICQFIEDEYNEDAVVIGYFFDDFNNEWLFDYENGSFDFYE